MPDEAVRMCEARARYDEAKDWLVVVEAATMTRDPRRIMREAKQRVEDLRLALARQWIRVAKLERERTQKSG